MRSTRGQVALDALSKLGSKLEEGKRPEPGSRHRKTRTLHEREQLPVLKALAGQVQSKWSQIEAALKLTKDQDLYDELATDLEEALEGMVEILDYALEELGADEYGDETMEAHQAYDDDEDEDEDEDDEDDEDDEEEEE